MGSKIRGVQMGKRELVGLDELVEFGEYYYNN